MNLPCGNLLRKLFWGYGIKSHPAFGPSLLLYSQTGVHIQQDPPEIQLVIKRHFTQGKQKQKQPPPTPHERVTLKNINLAGGRAKSQINTKTDIHGDL